MDDAGFFDKIGIKDCLALNVFYMIENFKTQKKAFRLSLCFKFDSKVPFLG